MFEISLTDEFYIFLISINYGLIIGLIYDLYRVLRYYSKPKQIKSFIEDLLLWIIISIIFFIFLFRNTDGVIRGFVVLGFIVGFVFYIKIISKYNFPLLIKIFRLIFSVFNEIIHIIIYPYIVLKKFLKKVIKKILLIPKALIKDIKKYRKIFSKKK